MSSNHNIWKNKDIFKKNPESFYTLSKADINDIDNALNQVIELNLPYFTLRKGDVSFGDFKNKLVNFREIIEYGNGVLRLRGLPIKKYSVGELKIIFYIICLEFGRPTPQSSSGNMIGIIETLDDPKNTKNGKIINRTGSPESLPFHTEAICDINSLFYIQNSEQGGELYISNSYAIYNYLLDNEPNILDELCKPYYYKQQHFNKGRKEVMSFPVFSVNNGKVMAHCVPTNIKNSIGQEGVPEISDLQMKALDRFVELANSEEFSVSLNQEEGDMIFLNCFNTLHARTKYKDSDDASKKRKMFRVFLYEYKHYEVAKPKDIRLQSYVKVVPDMVN
ncbi:TauD/TfdA family dioxygenase [Francisella sp. 19X1-34]|uniref:TauD/TfdA family dioxygenase n=1 Tax=Francisella sp. 19X1-34 TaxID=3087177 RepID=UPI002E349E5D|nr:TauD/TfdA family dioxygenase [Francisella sp. 19X1-34]MED7788544.1 TauD/TfdA family dioxygenase [Francisella sp. 19X1-34]